MKRNNIIKLKYPVISFEDAEKLMNALSKHCYFNFSDYDEDEFINIKKKRFPRKLKKKLVKHSKMICENNGHTYIRLGKVNAFTSKEKQHLPLL